MVKKYPKQITQLTFDLISPNMANITRNLQLNLNQLYEDTNTHKTKVELNADHESYLDIKKESKFVNSLVDYSADVAETFVEGCRQTEVVAYSPITGRV